MHQSNSKKKVVIIGAGPSSLIIAKELAKKGWKVDIFEALDRVGGMCRSFEWNGYIVDIGPHVFHTSDKSLEKYWKNFFGDLLVEGVYWSQNVKGELFDQFYDYPLSWESISSYPENTRKKIIEEIESLGLSPESGAENYSEYIDSIAGKTLRKMFFKDYPEKIWGISVDDMTADWAPKRVNIYKNKTPFFDKQWTAIGIKGAGLIYERISNEIQELGGNVNLNSKIVDIDENGSTIKSIATNKGKIHIGKQDVVISTIPVVSLLKMLGHESKLKYRGVIIIYIDCIKEQVLPDGISWQYFDSNEVYFTRVTEPKQMGAKCPSKNRTLITIEVPYSSGDFLDLKDTKVFYKEIIQQIVKVGLLKEREVGDITLVKEKFVYPVQYSGYQRELADIESIIGKYEQLYSLGAGARFNYTDTQVLFKKAFDLAESLTSTNEKSIQAVKHQSSINFNKTIQINKRVIGGDSLPYIIAEAGMNHNGSLNLGRKIIDV